jgi:cytochrome c553
MMRDKWVVAGIGLSSAVVVAGFIIGFAWLPLAQPGASLGGIWDAICDAAGLARAAPSREAVVQPDHPTTTVAVTPQLLDDTSAATIGQGATIALRCSICHGLRGLSLADVPNLAGQFPIFIYKQLVDFKTGARVSATMAPLVAGLDDRDMRDVAVYYGSLPRVVNASVAGDDPPAIVANGAPMRGIAPCGACHGEFDRKASAAWLEGQPVTYLRAQLLGFGSGRRRNDIGEQMRNVARGLTGAEIEDASRYYAGRP